jgi:hypothetical protein
MYKIKLHVISNTISRIIKYLWKISEAGKPVTGKLIQQLENILQYFRKCILHEMSSNTNTS